MTAPRNHRWPEAGVTIIEAMVVLLVAGTLLAIAIPTFTGARQKTEDASAQHSLRDSLTAADVLFTDHRSFTDANIGALAKVTPTIHYAAGDVISTAPTYVSVDNQLDGWSGAAQSESGNCFLISARPNGRVFYGRTVDGLCDGLVARERAHADSW